MTPLWDDSFAGSAQRHFQEERDFGREDLTGRLDLT